MKTTLTPQKNVINTEADDFAEEVRYAVTHKGKELHAAPKKAPEKKSVSPVDQPWQVD